MTGRNINIYLNENLHQQLVPLIKERKVSKFINEAIEAKLSQERQQTQDQLQKKLIIDYRSVAKSKSIQEETKIWDETLNDAWHKEKKDE
jgi:metal-responsive CopG/Arc/MetJ family transcriptional regulator